VYAPIVCHCPHGIAYGARAQVWSAVAKQAMAAGYMLPPDRLGRDPEEPEEGKYHGAFVLDADRGVHPLVRFIHFF